jgi:undecaprenyl-diphosphatase
VLGPASPQTRRAARFAAIAAAGLFAVLCLMVATGSADAFDHAVRNAVHEWASPPLTGAVRLVTHLGSVTVLLALCAVAAIALYLWGHRYEAVSLALTLIATMLVNSGLKLIFLRDRPDAFFGDFIDTSSFPSGHSAFSCCFYLGLAATIASHVQAPAARIAIFGAAILLIAAIGFSRVYLGVHYPTDVLGGWLIGIMGVAIARAAGPRTPVGISANSH